ncbi:MAG: ATP synthase subunit I [Pseudomonadales bacterium]|jgi:F0F1-type ATP synthase assembly protein I
MSRLRQNSAIVAVLQAQVVLGLCCVGGFLLFDASFGKGALAGFASVFIPSIIMAWQHARTTQAARLLGQSVVKMVTTAALMAISFGVWAVNPVSFFSTFVVTQMSYLIALREPTTVRKQQPTEE